MPELLYTFQELNVLSNVSNVHRSTARFDGLDRTSAPGHRRHRDLSDVGADRQRRQRGKQEGRRSETGRRKARERRRGRQSGEGGGRQKGRQRGLGSGKGERSEQKGQDSDGRHSSKQTKEGWKRQRRRQAKTSDSFFSLQTAPILDKPPHLSLCPTWPHFLVLWAAS